jgi:hypothetical protein
MDRSHYQIKRNMSRTKWYVLLTTGAALGAFDTIKAAKQFIDDRIASGVVESGYESTPSNG